MLVARPAGSGTPGRSCVVGSAKLFDATHMFQGKLMNIYVGNLAFQTTEDELRQVFAEFGEVSSVKIISDRETGRSRGFGFVEMPNQAEAEAAISAINDKDVGGRNLRVNEARPRTDRPGPRRDRF